MNLDSIVAHLDALLGLPGFPDYPTALNGLQVDAPGPVLRVGAAVDANETTINAAAAAGLDLLLVHHGLFWDGLKPLTGRYMRRIRTLVESGTAVYSAHLPLDAHPELGNGILLARALGVEDPVPFGEARGVTVGWMGEVSREPVRSFQARVASAVDGPARLLAGGPQEVHRVAVVTGGAGSMVEEAAAAGADTFVTGEAAHHVFTLATELGVNVFLAGHYATEVFGVKALARNLQETFGLPWVFLDAPSGL